MRLEGKPVDTPSLSYVGSPKGFLIPEPPNASLLSLPQMYGLPGPAGPAGPAGPQGPAGAGMVSRVFVIDDFGADPTGVNNSNQALIDAYEALGDEPGIIMFGVGTYKLYTGLNSNASRMLKPEQSIVGQGSGLTRIEYRGPGAFLEFRNTLFGTTSEGTRPAGGAHGLMILGWNSAETNSGGIRYGDIWRMRITDVEISGFNRTGCFGLWGDNQAYWSERAYIECVVNQCSTCFLFESNTGDVGFSTGSFDYSQYWLSFVAQPNQHAFVLRSGTAGSKVSMNGASITLTGNCQLAPAGSTNTGVMFRVGKDNNDEASFSGTLNIGVETSGTPGGVAHIDFAQGDGPFWAIKSKVSATGAINLIPFSGSNFQYGSASSRTFAFGGLLKGSTSLGSTSNSQGFQSLQLVSQARGNWFLDATNCAQSIYICRATGGTFTLSYGGYTTSALPYNVSTSEMETALNALPSISGNVQVYRAQARFVNSILQDEVAFTVAFKGTMTQQDLPLITANWGGLTGSGPAVDVVMKIPGSGNQTYVFQLEHGNIFRIEPPPGTYRMRFSAGGLTAIPVGPTGESPFGVTTVDIWVRQPDSGGNAIFESPFFVPELLSGSTYEFKWMDGQAPIFSTVPGDFDIVRLTSHNFGTWIGQHLTRKSTTNVPVPASASASGIKGQIAQDANYIYTCVDTNTWKRAPLSAW